MIKYILIFLLYQELNTGDHLWFGTQQAQDNEFHILCYHGYHQKEQSYLDIEIVREGQEARQNEGEWFHFLPERCTSGNVVCVGFLQPVLIGTVLVVRACSNSNSNSNNNTRRLMTGQNCANKTYYWYILL